MKYFGNQNLFLHDRLFYPAKGCRPPHPFLFRLVKRLPVYDCRIIFISKIMLVFKHPADPSVERNNPCLFSSCQAVSFQIRPENLPYLSCCRFIHHGTSILNLISKRCMPHLPHQPFFQRNPTFQFKPGFCPGVYNNLVYIFLKQPAVKCSQHF